MSYPVSNTVGDEFADFDAQATEDLTGDGGFQETAVVSQEKLRETARVEAVDMLRRISSVANVASLGSEQSRDSIRQTARTIRERAQGIIDRLQD